MDYLDHNKEFRQRILLFVGYLLIGLAVVIAALVLKYQADGYGVNNKGDVIQNGLTFFSSHPTPADIYINDKLNSVKTNTRLALPSGIYNVKLTRSGYYDWQRTIEVNGGDVQHFDYPFLFPKVLTTKKVQDFNSTPTLMTQSPDKRWVIIQSSTNPADFILYDIKKPDTPATAFSLPAGLISKPAASGESWTLAEWADDNQHVLLQHKYDSKSEFILIDREAPQRSINLNATLNISPTNITLNDKKYDKYYLYDTTSTNLQRVTLKDPNPVPVLSNVLAYKTYSDDTIFYVSSQNTTPGKVAARLLIGNKTYNIRTLSAGSTYSVDLTKYDGVMYVVAAAAADSRAYIFKDPVGQLAALPKQLPASAKVLRVDQVNYVGFSPTAQYIVAENGNKFGVYDIENELSYNYVTKEPIDAPQTRASWMDGDRLIYTSNGKLTVFDYDYINLQQLMPSSSGYIPAFSPDYKYVYSIAPSSAVGRIDFTQTSLRTPADR